MTVDARAWDAIGKWHDSPDGLPGLQVLVAAAIRDAENAKLVAERDRLKRWFESESTSAREAVKEIAKLTAERDNLLSSFGMKPPTTGEEGGER